MSRRNQRVSDRARDRIIEVVEEERKRLEARRGELRAEIKSREHELRQVEMDLALTGKAGAVLKPKRSGQRAKVTDPAKAAGPRNVEIVREFVSVRGKVTQAEVRKGTGKNSGTVSNALKGLEAEGFIRTTGEVIDRSAEWELAQGPVAIA